MIPEDSRTSDILLNTLKERWGPEPIRQRLGAVYEFAIQEILSHLGQLSANHLDIGTYDGFAIPALATCANHVTSIDMDGNRLWEATQRPEVKKLMEERRVDLHKMRAQHFEFPLESFSSATIVEVFGAGFEGTQADVFEVFSNVGQVLKSDGILVFTIASKTIEENFFAPISLQQNKGFSMFRSDLMPILNSWFTDIQWYGQWIVKKVPEGTLIPDVANNPDLFIPRFITDPDEKPLFWICTCRKQKNIDF